MLSLLIEFVISWHRHLHYGFALCSHPYYFADLPAALFTLFQMMTLDDWSTVQRSLYQEYGFLGNLYVLVFTFIGHWVLLKLILAVCSSALFKGGMFKVYTKRRGSHVNYVENVLL